MSPLTEPTRLTLAKGQPVPNDPSFAFTSLLLHGNGTNGSTTITDSSPTPKTISVAGNAQISTAQSKFGGSSIAFDGSGDFISTASNPAIHVLGSDFTLEGWIYLASAQNDFSILSTYQDNPSLAGYLVRLTPTAFRFFSDNTVFDRTFSFSAGQWYHWAVTSASGVGRIFINGNLQGATFAAGVSNSSETLQIGRTHTTTTLDANGYMDDIRITKGVARYTSNFTPPTTPFPDF